MFILQNYTPFGKLVFQLSPFQRWRHYVLGSWNGKVKYSTFRTCFKMEAFNMYCEKVYVFGRLQFGGHALKFPKVWRKWYGWCFTYSVIRKWHCELKTEKRGNVKSQIEVQTALQTRAFWMQWPSTLAHPTLTPISPFVYVWNSSENFPQRTLPSEAGGKMETS